MTMITDLVGIGVSAEEAKILAFDEPTSSPARKVSTGLTATGSTLGTGLALTSFINIVSTTAASTGVVLPSSWPVGQIGFVQNNGANALSLYPPSASISINGGTAGSAVTIAAAAGNLIIRNSTTDFGAYVMAKEA